MLITAMSQEELIAEINLLNTELEMLKNSESIELITLRTEINRLRDACECWEGEAKSMREYACAFLECIKTGEGNG